MILNLRILAVSVYIAALAACGQTETKAPDAETESAPEVAAEIAPSFVGTWAANAAGCEIPQELMEAPVIFHADGYDQHEAHCTFATLDETSPNTWHANLACTVEGDEQSAALDMSVQGDTMTKDGQQLIRCPDDPPTP